MAGIEAELFTVRVEKLAEVPKRLVELAVVEKRLVVVAEVPVALTKVKFWRVVEPVTRSDPPILAKVVLGSKKNSAVVEELEPITTTSSFSLG